MDLLPFHDTENLHLASKQSLKINFSNEDYPAGCFYCFSCANKEDPNSGFGGWNKLAKKLKLRKLRKSNMYESEIHETDADMDLGLEENTYLNKEDLYAQSIEWKPTEDWRSINGNLLHDIGARKMVNKFGEIQLHLPLFMDTLMIGGVHCKLTKVEGQISYINTPGSWSHKCLFPLDYVKKRFGTKVLFLVEGPRDALWLIQHGLPALALLGSATKWCKAHVEKLIELNPKLIVLAFDADDAGRRATRKANKDLKELFKVIRLKMKDQQDPAQLKSASLKKIRLKIKAMRKKL